MSVYESNISKNTIDLKQPQYKDIDKRYFDQLIQLKVLFAQLLLSLLYFFLNLFSVFMILVDILLFLTDHRNG